MVLIVDYGLGNIGSIANMIKRIGYNSEISACISKINRAQKIILPGVGNFDKAIQNMTHLHLIEVIKRKALEEKIPILGICLGMQIMCKCSEEGSELGLSLIDAEVKKFSFNDVKLKIPHMGWNLIEQKKESPFLTNIMERPRFYFVHSYHVVCSNNDDILLTTNYGYDFVSAFERSNILGVQFHPEKSHKFGMKVLENFIKFY